jgi:hypothetical protein
MSAWLAEVRSVAANTVACESVGVRSGDVAVVERAPSTALVIAKRPASNVRKLLATVPASTLSTIRQPPKIDSLKAYGFPQAPNAMQGVFAKALADARYVRTIHKQNEGVHNRVWGELCTNKSASIVSSRAMVDRLQVQYRAMRLIKFSLADYIVHAHRFFRQQLESAATCVLPRSHLLLYIQHNKEDEATFSVGIEAQSAYENDTHQKTTKAISSTTELALQASSSKLKLQSIRNRPARILQSKQSFSMVVRTLEDKVLTISGSTLNWTQLIQNTKAPTLAEAERRRCGMTKDAEKFQRKIRCTALDQYASNKAKESSIKAARDGSWSSSNIDCHLHIWGLIMRAVFDGLYPQLGLGLMHFACSVNLGTYLELWADSVEEVAFAKSIVTRTPPSREAKAFRHQVLMLAMRQGTHLLHKRLSLLMLPTGDWRRRDKLEIYVPPGLEVNELQIRRAVSRGVANTTARRKYSRYEKFRLLEPEKACDEVLILEAISGLASETYPYFLKRVHSKGDTHQLSAEHRLATSAIDGYEGGGLRRVALRWDWDR